MQPNEKPIFMLEIGGFFQGWSKLSITGDGSVFRGEIAPPWDGAVRQFAVSEDDVRALRECLTSIGIRSWRKSYADTSILDGTAWKLNYAGRTHSGQNAYPEGFSDLQAFLAGRFDFDFK